MGHFVINLEIILGYGIPLLICVIMVAVFFRKAASQKADPLLINKPAGTVMIAIKASPEEAFEKILDFARSRGIKIGAASADRNCLVLADRASFLSWGFFYPIYIAKSGAGSQLEIGIKSRFAQDSLNNPVAKSKHKAIVSQIQALFSPS